MATSAQMPHLSSRRLLYSRDAPVAPRRCTHHRHGFAISLAGLLLAAAWVSALPTAGKGGADTVSLAPSPDVRPADFLAGVAEADASHLWDDPGGGVWVMTADERMSRIRYYRHGALYVSGGLVPARCSAWLQT